MLKNSARFLAFVSPLFFFLAFPSLVSAADSSYYLNAAPGNLPGQVILTWTGKSGIDNYHIVYGTAPGKYQHGALNVDGNIPSGKKFSFTVNYLSPGTKYYFALSPVSGSKGLPYTTEVSSLPKPGVVTPPQTVTTNQTVSTGTPNFQLTVVRGKKAGEIVLRWNHAMDGVQNYSVVYGTAPGKFQYGALNVGKVNEFKVGALKPGAKYYFALAPVKDGKAQFITQSVGSPGPSSVGGGSGSRETRGGSGASSGGTTAPSTVTSGSTGNVSVPTTTTGTTTTTTTTKNNSVKNNTNSGQTKK